MEIISVNNNYASGKRRLAAWFIDSIIVNSVLTFGYFTSAGGHHVLRHIGHWTFTYYDNLFSYSGAIWFLLGVLYFALMESSKYQATFGKIVLGIKVVDRNNQRIGFAAALLRKLSKLLSSFLFCIGFIMIIFDARKQGLHDKIADTFVVRD